MSYPRLIQTLIIEDEISMIEMYKGYFRRFIKDEVCVAPPCIVCGYEDALRELSGNQIFHMVILDLKLPEAAGGDAEGGSSRGLELVKRIAEREEMPVPVLLIATGDLSRITKFQPLLDQIEAGFYYGTIVGKSVDLPDEIMRGIEKVHKYTDFGIRLTDPTEQARPPLTPREEDLIRRCGLAKETAIGVNLQWWSAERRDWGAGGDVPQWVKVLQGRFLLRGEDGLSRPNFFKIESEENGTNAHEVAQVVADKLQHLRVVGFQQAGRRSLLVTDKAGPSNDSPVRLDAYLRQSHEDMMQSIPALAQDVAEQLQRFGPSRKLPIPLSKLLWNFHQQDTIAIAWEKVARASREINTDPDWLYVFLKSSEQILWVNVRPLQHGDLHIGNISLDMDGGRMRAYVFDAAKNSSTVCGRDLAALEVSLLLHQKYSGDQSLVNACSELYNGCFPEGTEMIPVELEQHHRNTLIMVNAIRKQALKENTPDVYSILLLDEVFIQLGSFAFGTSQNKIQRAFDAVELYNLLALWVGNEFTDNP